jgi:DNA repair exonuclease SbcCD ATPase subunit
MAGPDPQTGLDKLKGSLGALAEPALIFAATGSKAAAIWGGLKAVIIGNVLGPLSLVTGALIGITGAMKLFLGRIELVGKGIDKLRSLEQIKTQFDPLLGGAALAQKRLEELYSFASSTPFQLEGIAEANRTLQVLTKGALATVEGMKLIGDAAAVTGQSMQTIAFWTGRLYDGLKSGAPIGEASARLQEMGLISGDVRRKLEASRDAGDSFIDTFEILEKELKKSEGGMEKMSQTLGGLESTLADVRGKFSAEFAANFFEAEKESTAAMINMFQLLEPAIVRLGQVFSTGATAIAKFFKFITGGEDGFKTLANNISVALDAFLAFTVAVAANQIATMVGSLARGSSAALAFTTSINKTTIATIYAGHASKGLGTALLLTGKSFVGLGAKGMVAASGQLIFAGATKVAGFALGMFTSAVKAAFGALVANPLALIITGIVAVGAMLLRMSSNSEEAAKKVETIGKEFSELSDKIDEVIKSIKTFEDSLGAMVKVEGEIKSITKKMEELGDKAKGIGRVGLSTGDGKVLEAQMDSQIKGYSMLIDKINEIANISSNELQIGKQKKAQLEAELETRRELKKIAFDTAMANASEAEQISLMAKRMQEVGMERRVAEEASNSLVAKEDFEREDGRRQGAGRLAELEAQLERSKAVQVKAEAMRTFAETVGSLDARVAGFDEKGNAKEIQSEKELQENLKESISILKERRKAQTDAATGVGNITTQMINQIDTGDMKDLLFNEDMFPLGALTAFQAKLKDTSLNPATREQLEKIVSTLKKAAEESGQLEAEQAKVNARLAEMNRIQQRGIELFQIQNKLHGDLIDIDDQGFQVSKKKQEAQLTALKAELELLKRLGDEQKSIEDQEKAISDIDKEIAEGGDDKTIENLQKAKAEMQKQLKLAKENNKEVEKAQQQVEKLEKQIEKMAAELAESVRKIFADIAAELRGLEIDEAFLNMDFGEAFKRIQADNEANEKETQRRRVDELRKAGKTEEDARRIASEEAANREKAKENARQGTRNFSDRDNIKARLEMESKVFGDAESRKKLQAMNDQDFFRGKLEENLRAGFGDLEAEQLATQDLDSKLMRETPEMKVVADSFRRIGAGGQGVATDPMKILAERRLRVQELIQKDINKMANAILQEQDKEAVLR